MDITCGSCHTRLTLPDDKIPQGKKASFLCPKCRERIHIEPPQPDPGYEPPMRSDYDASEKAFDYIDENTTTALLCVGDPAARQAVETALQYHGYYTIAVDDVETALTRMKYHVFDVVILSENFGSSQGATSDTILGYLTRLDMSSRRKMFVILLSRRYRTMDRLMAFHLNVNLIVSQNNTTDIDKILSKGLKDHIHFYGVFHESMKKLGKA